MPTLDQKQVNLLKVISENAAVDASRIFSKWLKSGVQITMDNVEFIPFEEISMRSGNSGEASIGLYMKIISGIKGSMLFLFDEKSAFKLVDLLIRKPIGTTTELGELEQSALKETANIVGSAYLNSIRNAMEIETHPSPPVLVHDLTESIMESILMEQAEFQNESLFIETDFNHVTGKLNWNFFFLPILDSVKDKL